MGVFMETERLIIDPIREPDKLDYFHNISHDRKVLETFICKYTETPDELDISPYTVNEKMFAIRLKETGRLIGIILYFDDTEDGCEIGYGIGSEYWNRGYTTEAVKRFLDYCFEDKGFQTVYASFFTGNEASKRVMEKCGMTYNRFSEKELTYLGVERDLIYYSIVNREIIERAIAYVTELFSGNAGGHDAAHTLLSPKMPKSVTHESPTVYRKHPVKKCNIVGFKVNQTE